MGKIYACENCHFLFERAGKVEQCPDCGKYSIRPATEQECEEYRRLRLEFGYVAEARTALTTSQLLLMKSGA